MIPPLNGAEERAQRQGQINSDVTERRVCESVQGFPEQSGDVSVAGVGECGLLSVWCLLSFPVRRGSPTGTLASTDYRALGLSRQQITCPPALLPVSPLSFLCPPRPQKRTKRNPLAVRLSRPKSNPMYLRSELTTTQDSLIA